MLLPCIFACKCLAASFCQRMNSGHSSSHADWFCLLQSLPLGEEGWRQACSQEQFCVTNMAWRTSRTSYGNLLMPRYSSSFRLRQDMSADLQTFHTSKAVCGIAPFRPGHASPQLNMALHASDNCGDVRGSVSPASQSTP